VSKHPVLASPPARVIYHTDPAPRADLYAYSPAAIAARRREQQALYARWAARQEAIREHDRRVRHFLLGLGAVVGAGLLTAAGLAVWFVWRTLTGVGPGAWLAALAVVAVATTGAAVGGHRCITIVKHWH